MKGKKRSEEIRRNENPFTAKKQETCECEHSVSGSRKDAQRVKRETAVRKSCGQEPVSFSGFIGKETAKQKPDEN